MLDFYFITRKRHILARNHVIWRIMRENCFGGLGVGRTPKKKPSKHLWCAISRIREKKPLKGSWLNFARGEISRQCVCNFWWRSVKGFGRGDGSNFPFPHWLASSPFNTLALPWDCVIRKGKIDERTKPFCSSKRYGIPVYVPQSRLRVECHVPKMTLFHWQLAHRPYKSYALTVTCYTLWVSRACERSVSGRFAV